MIRKHLNKPYVYQLLHPPYTLLNLLRNSTVMLYCSSKLDSPTLIRITSDAVKPNAFCTLH